MAWKRRRFATWTCALGTAALAVAATPAAAKKGDLIVSTYDGNQILRVSPSSGSVDEIRSGPPMENASYTAFEPAGALVASDHSLDQLFRVNVGNGLATQFTDDLGSDVAGLDRAANGDFVVAATADEIVRVDRRTGEASPLASGAPLGGAWGLDATPNGTVFVADEDGAVIRIRRNGSQSVVASDASSDLIRPNDVATDARGTLFVVDDGADGVFRVKPKTGAVSRVASGIGDSYGVAVAPSGLLFVTDYEAATVNVVDPKTGDVDVIADATDGITSPLGIEIEPPKCKGKLATIVGSNKKDKLNGSKFADVIVGLKGNDKIKGGKGKDRICGGKGKDKLSGQGGKDKLDGGPGKDQEVQ